MAHRAFTLVELLVVISIIVILIALLAPSLEAAIYQAELAVCGSKQRAMLGTVTTYAADQKRHYPFRIGVRNPQNVATNQVRIAMGASHVSGRQNPTGNFDERPVLAPYMAINKAMTDEMCTPVNLETTDPESTVFAGYDIWWSWEFKPQHGGGRGSFKVGDRIEWAWADERNGNQVMRWNFSLLVGDRNVKTISTTQYQSSHPDQDGVLTNLTYQDEILGVSALGLLAGKLVWSYWGGTVGISRGLADYNYGYQDNSVRRFNDVRDREDGKDGDVRMVWTDLTNMGPGLAAKGDGRVYIPRE